MIQKPTIYIFCIRIIFFGLICLSSCTYDYFEDETNYVVYAPKANENLMRDDYKVNDVHILIYNGSFEKQRIVSYPFKNNMRTRVGNFNFRIYPGSHSVLCFANTAGLNFTNVEALDDAAFGLAPNDDNLYNYPEHFAAFMTDIRTPDIIFPGPEVVDTVLFEKRYSGKICIAFKDLTKLNPLLTYNNIGDIKIEASGVGVYQKLSQLTDSINTRSSRYSSNDKVYLTSVPYEKPYKDYQFGIDNYFFPSLDNSSNGDPLALKLGIYDKAGALLNIIDIELTEILHMNETIYIGVDGFKVFILNIGGPEQWNPDIESGGNESGGDSGIGV